MWDVLVILVEVAVPANLVASLVMAAMPIGRVRRAAARGGARARQQYGAFLGWLLLLLFGGPAMVFALLVLLLSWPEPWRAAEVLDWVMPFGILVTFPGVVALAVRMVVEFVRNDGKPMGVRWPVSRHRPRIP